MGSLEYIWQTLALTVVLLLTMGASAGYAEPIFLSKQYPRCTACHYSPTGGGLLTPYGRSLSREEISMLGRQGVGAAPTTEASMGEEAFLGGLLGNALGPVRLGLDIRPSHLDFDVPGRSIADRNLFMNFDLLAAYRKDNWTLYGEVGREITVDGWTVNSYEHWIGYQVSEGVSVRGGRFLPAYGVKFADHTSFTRSRLNLAQYDQIYGVELGLSSERTLVQVSVSPGRADSLIDDDGRQAFTTSGRVQFDLNPRTVLVGSVLYRDESELDPRSTDTGVAFGVAPVSWLTTWTQADVRFQERLTSDRSYILANQTSVEVIRGLWLRVSPQIRWTAGDPQGEVRRLVLGADVFPRTHWHVNLSYYRDRTQSSDQLTKTFLAQLHLYL